MTTIGIIVGSPAKKSINRTVAHALPALAEDPSVEFTIFDDLASLPLYNHDNDGEFDAGARAFKDAVAALDGVIIVTPEYSRSIPAVLKNALEWLARPYGDFSLGGKPVAIMGASPGSTGTAIAQSHLRMILGHEAAVVMGQPETYFQFNPTAFDENGAVVDSATASVLGTFVNAAIAHTRRLTA